MTFARELHSHYTVLPNINSNGDYFFQHPFKNQILINRSLFNHSSIEIVQNMDPHFIPFCRKCGTVFKKAYLTVLCAIAKWFKGSQRMWSNLQKFWNVFFWMRIKFVDGKNRATWSHASDNLIETRKETRKDEQIDKQTDRQMNR